MNPREVWRRLAGMLRRSEKEERLDEEIRFHVDQQTAKNIQRGMSAAEARRAALVSFGGIDRAKESARDEYRAVLVEDLARDARHAARALRRTPGFTIVAVLTLALGIGSTTAIFSVVNGVLLKPLPFDEPDRLMTLVHQRSGASPSSWNHGPATYFAAFDNQRVFENVGAWESEVVSITGVGDPEQIEALLVSHTTLPMLRVRPIVGRIFTEGEDRPGAPLRVLLTDGYWQRRFAGSRDVIGQSLRVDGRLAEVVGVLPPSFRFLDRSPEVVLPMQLDRADAFHIEFDFQALGRLKPGVTLSQANTDMARWITFLPDVFDHMELEPNVRPLVDHATGDIGSVLWTLLAAVGIVLLIACANAANLFLVRAEGRQRELALRAALGAGRGRLVRALLTESVLLAIGGGAFGLLLAQAAVGLLRRMAPADLPRVDEIGLDPTVLLFAFVLSVCAGVAFGLVGALRLSIESGTLVEGGRSITDGPRRHRTRNVLVVSQVALALVLLIASGLMVRTFLSLHEVHPGFLDPESVQTFRLEVPEGLVGDDAVFARLHERIAERLVHLPGVLSVGLSSSITMDGEDNGNSFYVEDALVTDPPLRRFKSVGPGYFETMGNGLLAGRSITWDDIHHGRPVLVITETLAREYWGDAATAVGKRARGTFDETPWREIVGVVGDERDDGLHRPATPIVYWPLLNDTYQRRSIAYVVRSDRAGTSAFLRELQSAVWSIDRNLPFGGVQTLDDIRAHSMARTSFVMVMLVIAAAVALLLGVVGIYGVISYIVTHRTRELGIRMALGAQCADVRRAVLAPGLRLTAVGLGIGVAGALVITRLLSALLYGVSPLDATTYLVATAGLASVALFATWLPARRAARLDPMMVLRADA